jgi:hypothetical protein
MMVSQVKDNHPAQSKLKITKKIKYEINKKNIKRRDGELYVSPKP